MNIRPISLAIAVTVLLVASLALAQSPGGRERRPRDRTGPPREPDTQRADDRARGPGGPNRQGAGDRQGRSRNPLVLALDTDGDGELSPAEIAGAAEALKSLDKNRNGNLSREEMRPADGGQGGATRPNDQRPFQDNRRGPGGDNWQGGQRPDTGGGGDDLRNAPSTRPTVSIRRTALPSPIPGFVGIPGGEFEMGDHHDLGGREHRSDEVPIRMVRVDPFLIAETEATNRQYCEFLNSSISSNGAIEKGAIEKGAVVKDGLVYASDGTTLLCDTHQSDRASSITWDGRSFAVLPRRNDHPVVGIRWHGAAAYCNWLSLQKGREPCYDSATWKCDYGSNGFRLPTEAEWEYAGRGGRYDHYTIFPWGDDPDSSKANWPNSRDPFESGSLAWTTPVGFYSGKLHRKEDHNWPSEQETYQTLDGSNGYGLYDVSGNVWEWTGDWYRHDYYAASPKDNPHGPEKGQPMRDGKPYRVLRSGSWYNGQWGHGRVANRNPSYYRGPDDPNHRYYHIGFRIVLKAPNIK